MPLALMPSDRIPLFPLNVVLFPGEQLPLHIFEPRYRRMVRECLDSKSRFGLLLAMPNGVVHVGCTAEILEVLKSYDDGRLDIITVGRDLFQVCDIQSDDSLLRGDIDYLEDLDSLPDATLRNQLIEYYETCHTILFSSLPRDLDSPLSNQLSFTIAAALPLDLLWKQQILEIRSEADRQQRLIAYLRDWAPHLQKEAGLRLRATGNGYDLN
jgi:Lon protease-like protein